MTSSTPENSQPNRESASPSASSGRQPLDPRSLANGGEGATGAGKESKSTADRTASTSSDRGGPTQPSDAKGKQSTKKPQSAKTGSDWSVFRTVVVLVGLVIAGFGAYYLITGTAGLPDTGDGAVNPTLENQFRFFAAMMVGVGAAFVTIAIKFQWANMLWLVCLMVFIGGIGRVLSWAFSGTPHYLLIILMVVELAFPAALLVWHRYIAKTSELRQQYASRS